MIFVALFKNIRTFVLLAAVNEPVRGQVKILTLDIMEKEMVKAMQSMIESIAALNAQIPNEVAKTLHFDYVNDSVSNARRLIDEYRERLAIDHREMNESSTDEI